MAVFSRFDDYDYIRWAREVKIRDHYCCVLCGRRGYDTNLNSHHLNAWASFPEERFLLSNGVTLCSLHHNMFHELYGKGKNTKEQFEEFSDLLVLLQSEAEYQVKVENAEREALKLIDGYQIAEKILISIEKES